jgi:nitroimidazol reductase NimA-like FMN-containing flavoprotein (pyridoxamine 5'-phosphate oxidase superfamily)
MARKTDPTFPETPFEPAGVNRVKQLRDRGHYDRDTVFPIVDAALIAQVGFVEDGRPVIIPMVHGRDGDRIFIHGHRKSRTVQREEGEPVCLSFTHVDGIVFARSIFESSMNYRAAVIHGTAHPIEDEQERLHALRVTSEQVFPGRWDEVREPYEKELKGTGLFEVRITAASAKIRQAPVADDYPDPNPKTWAGIVPVATAFGAAIPDRSVEPGLALPDSVVRLPNNRR